MSGKKAIRKIKWHSKERIKNKPEKLTERKKEKQLKKEMNGKESKKGQIKKSKLVKVFQINIR